MPAARSGTSRSPFFDGGDELAAERRDVLHHTPPHDGAVAKGRLVHPGCAGVHQVVLDAEAPGRLVPADDAGGDADQPGMADQPDDLALAVGLGHQAGDLLVPTELVRSPPAGHHDRVEVVGGHVLRRDVAARQARSVRHDGLTSAIRDYRSGASGWPPPLRTEPLRSSREGPGWASPHRWLSTRGRSIPSPPRPGGVWPCSPPLRARTPGPGARRTRTSRPPGSPGPARTWKRSARGIRPASRTGTRSPSSPGRPGTAGSPARPDAASS